MGSSRRHQPPVSRRPIALRTESGTDGPVAHPPSCAAVGSSRSTYACSGSWQRRDSSVHGHPSRDAGPGTVAWLLDCDDLSVRYFTLTLLGEPADGVAAAKTRCRIVTDGVVQLILVAHREEGRRCERERFYTAKYTSRLWQLIILAELGADGGDERLRRAREAVLVRSRAGRRNRFGVWNIDS